MSDFLTIIDLHDPDDFFSIARQIRKVNDTVFTDEIIDGKQKFTLLLGDRIVSCITDNAEETKSLKDHLKDGLGVTLVAADITFRRT